MKKENWKWFGNAGHLCISQYCRFHLCTKIGKYLISTVGEYLPSQSSQEIIASSKGFTLEGRGDSRQTDFLKKIKDLKQ